MDYWFSHAPACVKFKRARPHNSALHERFIVDVKDGAVSHVTVFTFRMKNSSHVAPRSPLGQHGQPGVDMHVASPHMAESAMSDKHHLHQQDVPRARLKHADVSRLCNRNDGTQIRRGSDMKKLESIFLISHDVN